MEKFLFTPESVNEPPQFVTEFVRHTRTFVNLIETARVLYRAHSRIPWSAGRHINMEHLTRVGVTIAT